MEEGVGKSPVTERILASDGITDTGIEVEKIQNHMDICGDTLSIDDEEGVRDTCDEEIHGQNKETLSVGLSDDEVSSDRIRLGIWPKLHKNAHSIVIGLLAGIPSNRKLKPANSGQKSKSKSLRYKTHIPPPNRSVQPIDGEKVEKRKATLHLGPELLWISRNWRGRDEVKQASDV
ncbi:hypothetical protein Ancab_011132 [Ancistrocladus abbreviatus]